MLRWSLSWGIIFSVREEKTEEAGGKRCEEGGERKKGRSGILDKNASSNFACICQSARRVHGAIIGSLWSRDSSEEKAKGMKRKKRQEEDETDEEMEKEEAKGKRKKKGNKDDNEEKTNFN